MGRVGMNRVAVVLLGNDSNLGRQLQQQSCLLSPLGLKAVLSNSAIIVSASASRLQFRY